MLVPGKLYRLKHNIFCYTRSVDGIIEFKLAYDTLDAGSLFLNLGKNKPDGKYYEVMIDSKRYWVQFPTSGLYEEV